MDCLKAGAEFPVTCIRLSEFPMDCLKAAAGAESPVTRIKLSEFPVGHWRVDAHEFPVTYISSPWNSLGAVVKVCYINF